MVEVASSSIIVFAIILQVFAAYYAFKITRLAGSFRAWTMIIVAFILLALRNVATLLVATGVAPGGILGLGGQLRVVADQIALPFAISLLLLLAMYDLHRLFRLQSSSKRQAESDQAV